ncbi:MAG: NHL repeat-containing protein [Pedobacter sp.]|uniref:NHL repeat-containing protein n=1 Tax=Pedobacter sp. TaxID=1411316 RepID=UPI003563B3DC
MKKTLYLIALCAIFASASCKKGQDQPTEIKPEPETEIKELDRPVYLSATKGLYGNRIIITWTPIPLAKNYRLYKFDDISQTYKLTKETADTSFTDLEIKTPLSKVFYKLMVYNSAIELSKFSDVEYGYTSGQNYSKYFSFGSEGSAAGQFSFAMHVEVDANNNIYVSDEGNNRVQKFDKDGKYLETFFLGSGARAIAFLKNGNTVVSRTQSSSYVKLIDKQKNVLKEWGTYGTGDTQFKNIEEITVDDEDNIYIVDGQNNAVKKFDQNGEFLLKFTAATKTTEQVDGPYPYGICFLNNKIFVTSPRNDLVRVFDKTGKYLKSWNSGSSAYAIKAKGNYLYLACNGFIMKTDENGEIREEIGKGQFYSGSLPGLAVNSNDEIIISDLYARRIIVFKHL